ncbi:MAG: tetratricopeptide repeat protein, partial [Bacteroidota bacterium]
MIAIRWCFAALFLVVITNRSVAQRQDSLLGLRYARIADTSYLNVDTCIRYTYLALPLLKKTGQWEQYVTTYAGLSYCYNTKGYLDSLVIVNRAASAAAEAYLPAKHHLLIATKNNLGVVYRDVYQDFDQALHYFETALAHFDSSKARITFKANVLKNIGNIHIRRGDFNLAELYLKETLNTYRSAAKIAFYEQLDISFRVAESYQALAKVAQYQADYSLEKAYLLQMLQLLTTSERPFATSYYLACYTELAEVSLQLNDPTAATRYVQLAFALPNLRPDQEAEVYYANARLHAAQNAWKPALAATELALARMSSEKVVDMAKRQELRATCLLQLHQTSAALQATNIGLKYLAPTQSWSTASYDLVLKDFRSPTTCLQLLLTRASIQQQLAVAQGRSTYLDTALLTYHYVAELSDALRRDYQSQEAKLFLGANSHDYYEKAIALAEQRYQQT